MKRAHSSRVCVAALSSFKARFGEAIFHFLFLGLLFTAALQSFNPEDRFAFRTRVLDMVLDEFNLEGLYPVSWAPRACSVKHPFPRECCCACRGR